MQRSDNGGNNVRKFRSFNHSAEYVYVRSDLLEAVYLGIET